MDALVREWTQLRDKWAIADELQAAGIAAAPVDGRSDTDLARLVLDEVLT